MIEKNELLQIYGNVLPAFSLRNRDVPGKHVWEKMVLVNEWSMSEANAAKENRKPVTVKKPQ